MPGQANSGNKKMMDCPPASTKLMSLCDLCSCWWNCMIFSESATMPDPFINIIPDTLPESSSPQDIVTQPTSTALVPVNADKRWQFDGGRVKSNFGHVSFSKGNMSKEDRKRLMDMKEERHKIKLEILKLEREMIKNKMQSGDDTRIKLITEEVTLS
ncbi:uncharacterized protein LOC118766349 [Octopus sinensis]|uniref:Uncharacterized protein LOC118766349 n=1 Tax=Octopus sinensis TaxID=2607531 RepID=A0A7E6FDK7_9MOLL|nr:uncharacterized protein LOC118766349 [Octopus sinensis]